MATCECSLSFNTRIDVLRSDVLARDGIGGAEPPAVIAGARSGDVQIREVVLHDLRQNDEILMGDMRNRDGNVANVLRGERGTLGDGVSQFDALRKQGHLKEALPESERIYEAIVSNFNPFEIAKDKVDDALFKRHFPMLAPVVGWANTPIIPTLEAFVDSEDVATDYNELRLMNNAIQRQVNGLIPYLKSDWQELTKAVEQAAPQLKMP